MKKAEVLKVIQLAGPFVPNGGFAFTANLSEDSAVELNTQCGLISENGKIIGPGNALHQAIRDSGEGRFSVWGGGVFFSASDNTDPNTNGRQYELLLLDLAHDHPLFREFILRLEPDDKTLLQAIAGNSKYNNSIFSNFFRYYNDIEFVLKRHRLSVPDSILEVGSGQRPFTALRFLLEGTKRYAVNDMMKISRHFAADLIDPLRDCLCFLAPPLVNRMDEVLVRRDDGYELRGLEVFDEQPIWHVGEVGPFGFISSVSVLEHVTDPRRTVDRMSALLAPGGIMWHSIDLRDHSNFDLPLRFLFMTDQEYARINTENRARASDWMKIFEDFGFEILESNDAILTAEGHQALTLDPKSIQPGVTTKMREAMAPPFNQKDLPDLSTLMVQVLCRKRS